MTVKAERLVRALVELRLNYGDADFEEAERLLRSGDYLNMAIRAAENARSLPTSKSQANRRGMKEPAKAQDAMLARIHNKASSEESVSNFLRKYLNKEILTDVSANRAFSDLFELRLPKKLPSRIYLADRYVSGLLGMPVHDRERAIEQAERLGSRESSLQLWSDVINRRDK